MCRVLTLVIWVQVMGSAHNMFGSTHCVVVRAADCFVSPLPGEAAILPRVALSFLCGIVCLSGPEMSAMLAQRLSAPC